MKVRNEILQLISVAQQGPKLLLFSSSNEPEQ